MSFGNTIGTHAEPLFSLKSEKGDKIWKGDDATGPISKRFCAGPGYIKTGLSRDGIMYEETQLELYMVNSVFIEKTEGYFMVVVEQLKENYEAISELWGKYRDKLTGFRDVAKNDLHSLEAAARKTKEAATKLTTAYADVIVQLNSEDFSRAVENAERLVVAMKALSELQAHKLVFSVLDQTSS